MNSADMIKKGLEVHSNFGSCADDCPYDAPAKCGYSCSHTLTADSLTLIQQHESNWQQVSKALCGKENATLEEVLLAVSQVKADLKAVTRERDAAVRWLSGNCNVCRWAGTEKCDSCDEHEDSWFDDSNSNWEWEGVCPENPEVQEDA